MSTHVICVPMTALAVLAILGTAGEAVAQQPSHAATGGSVRPDRPYLRPFAPRIGIQATTTGCDPDTVEGTCPGTYSFTYGFTANARPEDGGLETEKAGLAFGVYVTRRLSLEVDNDNVVSTSDTSGNRVTGFGDTTVYVGGDAFLEKGPRPGLSLIYGLKIPTASETKGLGTGKVDHTLLALLSKTYGRTYLEVDGGDYVAGRSDGSGLDHFPFATGILVQPLGANGRFKLHIEFGGDFATSKSRADAYMLDYLESTLPAGIVLRTGMRVGLTSNVARYGLYVALKHAGQFGKTMAPRT